MKIFNDLGKHFKSKTKKAPTIENIAVFGYSDTKEGDPLFNTVIEVTKALAEAGYVVVDGGGPGVMRAATIGAKKGGGKVVAVTLQPSDMTHFEARDPGNDFDIEIKTHSYVERTLTLMREGQVYIVFQGGTGTISEFAMAWGLARLYFGHHKPLILYGDFWYNIIKSFHDNMLLRPEEMKVFKIVSSPNGVLKAIKEFEEEISRGEHGHHLKATRGDYII